MTLKAKRSTRAKITVAINRLHQVPEMTLAKYFSLVDRDALTDHELEVLESNKHLTVHDFVMDSVTMKRPTEDFEVLAFLDRESLNHLELLLRIYCEVVYEW